MVEPITGAMAVIAAFLVLLATHKSKGEAMLRRREQEGKMLRGLESRVEDYVLHHKGRGLRGYVKDLVKENPSGLSDTALEAERYHLYGYGQTLLGNRRRAEKAFTKEEMLLLNVPGHMPYPGHLHPLKKKASS